MFRLFVLSLILGLALGQTNYCQVGLCPAGVKHIGCQNSGSWAASCPTGVELVPVNSTLVNHIVVAHNRRRNNLAVGDLTGYSTARRMGTIRWNAELASLATLNVKRCVELQDACHNTASYPNSGQNMAVIKYAGDVADKAPFQIFTEAIQLWWSQNTGGNMAGINSYPSNWNGQPVRSFALMAQQSNLAVGCAAARYVKDSLNHVLVTCNYAVNNVIGKPVYVTGLTAVGCQLGTNVNFEGLCKFAETNYP